MFHVVLVLPVLAAAYAALVAACSVVSWMVLWFSFFRRRTLREGLHKRTTVFLSMLASLAIGTVLTNAVGIVLLLFGILKEIS